MNGQNSDSVIDVVYTEVDAEGNSKERTTEKGANENTTEDTAESVEERLRIKRYDELDPKRKATVDAIIETINVFNLSTIFSLGKEAIDEHNRIVKEFVKEQDEHDKEDGIFAELSAITGVTEESAASKVFKKAKQIVESTKEVVVDTVVSVKEKVGVMARIVGMIGYPLVLASNKFQEWKDGEEGKTKEKKRGIKAEEYADGKNKREKEFQDKYTIPQELMNDVLEALAKENAVLEKLEKIVQRMPTLRETFDGLVMAQVVVFDVLEDYIIAGRKEIDTLKNRVIPEQEEEALRIGTQERIREVESMKSGLDRLVSRVFTLENFRYSAMMGAISFHERKTDLDRIEGECGDRIANSNTTLSRLVSLRYSLMKGKMDQWIAESKQGEINQIRQDTALNLVMADFHKNKSDLTPEFIKAQEENLLSKKREALARRDSIAKDREEMERGREKMQALAEDAARLAAPTDANIARIRQDVADADAAAERERNKGSLALDWSARRPANTGDAPARQALTPVRTGGPKDKPRPKNP